MTDRTEQRKRKPSTEPPGTGIGTFETADAAKAEPDKGSGHRPDWLKPLSAEFNSTFNSKYVWRGLAVVDQPVWQPEWTIGYGPVSFCWWGNMDLSRWGERAGYAGGSGESKLTEIDYAVDLSIPVDIFTLSTGYVAYTFPHTGWDSTTELYTGVGVDMPLNPTLTVYYDVDEAKGRYGALSFSHDMELFKVGKHVSVGLEGSITGAIGSREFNDFYYGVSKCTMTDLQLDFGLPITVFDHVNITPAIHWSKVVNPELRRGPTRDDTVWIGITTGVSF